MFIKNTEELDFYYKNLQKKKKVGLALEPVEATLQGVHGLANHQRSRRDKLKETNELVSDKLKDRFSLCFFCPSSIL